MSIVRIGMAERKGYADNYDAIFGKGKKKVAAPVAKAAPAKPAKTKTPVKAKPVAAVKKTTAGTVKKATGKK